MQPDRRAMGDGDEIRSSDDDRSIGVDNAHVVGVQRRLLGHTLTTPHARAQQPHRYKPHPPPAMSTPELQQILQLLQKLGDNQAKLSEKACPPASPTTSTLTTLRWTHCPRAHPDPTHPPPPSPPSPPLDRTLSPAGASTRPSLPLPSCPASTTFPVEQHPRPPRPSLAHRGAHPALAAESKRCAWAVRDP